MNKQTLLVLDSQCENALIDKHFHDQKDTWIAEHQKLFNEIIFIMKDAEMKILMKAAKQRRDSLEVFKAQNRDDLAEKEQVELTIIEEFLPKQLSEEELTAKITEIIAQVGATGPGDMGKVMGAATKQLAGLADGKAISAKVGELLKK